MKVLLISILLLVWSVTSLTHANEFLGAFAAGITVASISTTLRDRFHGFGETASELIKVGALLLFGAMVSIRFLAEIPGNGYLFALLAILLVRPLAMTLALINSGMPWQQRLVAGWFGPKGFASVVFGLFILHTALPDRNFIFHLIALVVAASIVMHSTTDVIAAGWLGRLQNRDPHVVEEERITQAAA